MSEKVKRQAIDQYYDLLHCSKRSALEARIINQIQRALGPEASNQPPIRLKLVAAEFQIRENPIYDPTLESSGTIVYDRTFRQFKIILSNYYNESGHVKFTYAHEFAHRFFFVRDGQNWKRALEIVVDKISDAQEKVAAFQSLNTIEEEKCNRIASEVLLPEQSLREILSGTDFFNETFPDLLTRLSTTYSVSRECAMARLRRVPLGTSPKFVAFLLTHSRSRYRGGEGDIKARMKSLLGNAFADLSLQYYPGISLRTYGPDFDQSLSKIAAKPPIFGVVEPIETQIAVKSRRLPIHLQATAISKHPQSATLVWGCFD